MADKNFVSKKLAGSAPKAAAKKAGKKLSGKEKAALAAKDSDEDAAERAQLKQAKGPSTKGKRGVDDEEEAAAPKAKGKTKAKKEDVEEDFSKVKGKKTKTGKDYEEKADEAEEEKVAEEVDKPAQKKDKKKAKWGAEGEEASKPEEASKAKAGKNAKQEEEAPGPAAASAEDASEDGLTVAGVIASCEPLRKKGNFLLSVTVGSKQVQVVAPKEYDEGQKVRIALEGATLENGKTVKREKIAGEWSEGSLIN